MDANRFLIHSEKLDMDGLDWDLARKIGLTADERFVLTYFADIESQTILYLRDLLGTQAALDDGMMGFLSTWNYEEYFHGVALARLLEVCGCPLTAERAAHVRRGSQLSEKVEAFFASLLSKVFAQDFPAVYLTWGAVQELTTLRGYERLIATTQNPVLAEISRRIAKQERRHFAWYWNSARERLAASPSAQRLTRSLLSRFWTPVGAGVKPDVDVARLLATLFPGSERAALAEVIDVRIGALPGLEGIELMGRYARRLARRGRSAELTCAA
jgi:rubrerythrin